MKKKICLLLLLLLPFNVCAKTIDDYVVNGNDDIKMEEDVSGSTLLAGKEVSVESKIDGVGILFGEVVSFDGELEYGLLAGQKVLVNGIVNNDAIFAGETITFSNNFASNRDVFVFGQVVNVSGNVDRNMVISAEKVIIDSANVEKLKIKANTIEIKGETIISSLNYNEDADILINDEVSIVDTTLTSAINKTTTETVLSEFISYAGILVVFVVAALIVPNLFKRIEKQHDLTFFNFASMMGYGALALIAIPVLIVVLFGTIIGIPLAIILLALYIATFMLSIIFVGYYLGLVIYKKVIKKETNILLAGLMGISLLYLLTMIPTINFIVVLIYCLAGMGIVIKLFAKDN